MICMINDNYTEKQRIVHQFQSLLDIIVLNKSEYGFYIM